MLAMPSRVVLKVEVEDCGIFALMRKLATRLAKSAMKIELLVLLKSKI